MENQFEWASVSDLNEARKIARVASLAVPELQPDFDKPDVDISSQATVADYRFVKITDKAGKELYGFVPTDFGCFIPLDKNRQAFEFLRFYLNDAYTDEVNRVQALLVNIEVAQENGIPYGNYLPWKDGKYVPPGEAIRQYAQSYYKESGIEQGWQYKLPFWNVSLFEFMFAEAGKRIAKYALFREDADEVKDFEILTGISDDVYRFVSEENGLVPENMAAYLKFFCWALEANEGKFVLPEAICEVSWERVPEKEKWYEIHAKVKVPNPVWLEEKTEPSASDDSAKSTNATAMVAYSQAFFDARFLVKTDTGEVAMIDDNPLLGDLPFKPLRFSTEKGPDNTPSKIDESPTEVEPEEYPENLRKVREMPPISPEDFLALLKKDGRVDFKRITGKISIGDCSLGACQESVSINHCWFDDEVRLTTHEASTEIRFADCMFVRLFSAKDCMQKKSLLFDRCRFNDILDKTPTKQATVADFENYRSEGSLIFRDCYLLGPVYATTMKLSGNLSLKNCLVSHSFFKKNEIRFTQMKSVTVEADPTTNNTDSLKYVLINGKKVVHAVAFLVDCPILNIDNSTIKGNLEISTDATTSILNDLHTKNVSLIVGDISARGVEVTGRTTFIGAFVVGSLTLENGTFHQNVDFNEFVSSYIQFNLTGNLILDNGHISGSLNLGYSDIGGTVNFYSMHVEVSVFLLGTKITGSLNLNFSIVKGMLIAARDSYSGFDDREILWIGGTLRISAADIKHIRLEGARVDGNVEIITGQFHSIWMTFGTGFASSDPMQIPFRTRSIWMSSIKVQGKVNLSGVEITSGDMQKLEELRKEIGHSSCTIRASQIGDDLLFFSPHPFKNNPDAPYPKTTLEWGDMNLEANIVGGYLDLRQTQIAGDILLMDTQVQLGLNIDEFCRIPQLQSDPLIKRFSSPTHCRNLDIEKCSVNGNVFLSGLNTKKDLRAKNVQVKGYFSLNDSDCSAKIGGSLDLTGAEINSINLAGKNFPAPLDTKSSKARIILERAKINKLTVLSQLPDINLSDAHIFGWKICDPLPDSRFVSRYKGQLLTSAVCLTLSIILLFRFAVPAVHRLWPDGLIELFALFVIFLGLMFWFIIRPKKDAARYLQILNRMKPSEKSPYVDIEMMLRNISKDEDANMIYRAMRKKSRKAYGHIQQVLDFLWYFFTGYGTRLWVLLFMWFGLFFVTAFYVSYPGNHKPIPTFTSNGSCCLPDESINPETVAPLTTLEALMLAGKHCIPGMDFPANGAHVVTEHTGPWLDLIYLTSFILLSLFGVSVTAKLIRGKQ